MSGVQDDTNIIAYFFNLFMFEEGGSWIMAPSVDMSNRYTEVPGNQNHGIISIAFLV